jgi:LysR family transcriptional regulator, regulator of the ytmI operon
VGSSLQDLATERLLLTETNCPYRQVFEQKMQSHGVNPYSGLALNLILKTLQDGLIQ